MASNPWHQGSQPLMQNNDYYQQPVQQPVQQQVQPIQQQPVQRRKTNPPPVCFNCGVEGHFLVACPEATRNTPGGFPPAQRPYQKVPGPSQHNQPYAPQHAPVQHPSYQTTPQYGGTGQPYSYNHPQPQQAVQPYGQPQQYGQPGFQPGYQPPPYTQYHPGGPSQFSTLAYQGPPQQFALPPVPYQQPPNSYPPANSSYVGAYQAQPAPYQQPQPPQSQWNNIPPAPRPPYQQQQRRSSSQRGQSGTPSHQMQRQRSRSQQVDHSSVSLHATPQTPVSVSANVNQASRRGSLMNPEAKPGDESKVWSRASTPYGRCGSGDNLPLNYLTPLSKSSANQDYDMDKPEDVEVGDIEEEALFNWEFKHIFKEPARDQTVGLAQPLSANFKSTPVPLIQAWSIDVPSISRYARKENLKEFVRPIRELPQWSYSQEDPAFSDAKLNGPAITFEDLPFWTTAHHATMGMQMNEEILDTSLDVTFNEPMEISRKRGRSEEAEQSSQDYRGQGSGDIKLESSGDEDGGTTRAKRFKNVAERDEDDMMQTSAARTPVIGYRIGTPGGETEGDAWAPEPGETASTPQSPTEALLASLGVSGSPKPVKKEPVPAYMNKLEEQRRRSESSQPAVDNSKQTPHLPQMSPPVDETPFNHQQNSTMHHQNGHPTKMNNQVAPLINNQNGPPMNVKNQPDQPMSNQYEGPAPQYDPSANAPHMNGQATAPPYVNTPVVNFQQAHQQYGPPANAPYQNGPAHNYGNAQYGQQPNVPYNNGQLPLSNYGPPQQGQPQWTPPPQQSYNHGLPSHGPQGYNQYPQQQNPPYGNSQYGPVANPPYQNQPGPYYPPGPRQHVQQQYSSLGNGPLMPGNCGPQTQANPPQYFPPQNGQYGSNGYPNGAPQPQYNQGPAGPYHNGSGPPKNNQVPNGPPQQPFRGPNGSAPPRQDSGYISARESYSNDTIPQGFNDNHGHPPIQSNMDGALSLKLEHSSEEADTMSSQQMTRKDSETGTPATDSTGTPLSPTSMEILVKLERNSSAAKSGNKKVKDAARKPKRPQPVVAEAYSRRW